GGVRDLSGPGLVQADDAAGVRAEYRLEYLLDLICALHAGRGSVGEAVPDQDREGLQEERDVVRNENLVGPLNENLGATGRRVVDPLRRARHQRVAGAMGYADPNSGIAACLATRADLLQVDRRAAIDRDRGGPVHQVRSGDLPGRSRSGQRRGVTANKRG